MRVGPIPGYLCSTFLINEAQYTPGRGHPNESAGDRRLPGDNRLLLEVMLEITLGLMAKPTNYATGNVQHNMLAC